MSSYRVLLCVDERLEWSREDLPGHGGRLQWVGPVETGGEAMAKLQQTPIDVVVIVGDVDGCNGSRVAAAVGRRCGATVLLLSSPHEADALRSDLSTRGMTQRVTVVPVLGEGASPTTVIRSLSPRLFVGAADGSGRGRARVLPSMRREVVEIADSEVEATLLVGSAGTPQLLPELLGPRSSGAASLTVAVHHNPRWSDGFVEWVCELAGSPGAGVVEVVPATTVDGEPCLSPDVGQIITRVLNSGDRTLVCIASGMTEDGLEALSDARRFDALVVALDPANCPQPAMVHMAIGAGWTDVVVSPDELAWLIAHAGRGRPGFAMTG